jgi:hypothetical protein
MVQLQPRCQSCNDLRLSCCASIANDDPASNNKKEFPENVVAGRRVSCDRRATRQAQSVVRLASRLQLDHTTRHKSCHLLWLICMSVDAQSAPNETRSLCARKRKGEKNNFLKKNSLRLLLLAESSFAIDAQQQ